MNVKRPIVNYLLRRLGLAILVLFVTFTVSFFLMHYLPGDAITARYGNPDLGLSEAQVAEIRESVGANKPVWIQFWLALSGFLTGDFGYSAQSGAAVSDLLTAALPETLALTLTGFVLGVIVAFAIAFSSTFGRFEWLRRLVRMLPPLFISIPVFWFAIVLIQIFSFQLGWVPVIGATGVQALILPSIALSVPIAAPLAQILVRSIEEVRTRPFITVVRAKGASDRWLLWRNVLGNALLPALTIAGLLFGELIAGAVVTETVFGRSGIGRMTEQAVSNRDIPVLQAIVVISAAVFVLINLIVDLLYPIVDPRLRPQPRQTGSKHHGAVKDNATQKSPREVTEEARSR